MQSHKRAAPRLSAACSTRSLPPSTPSAALLDPSTRTLSPTEMSAWKLRVHNTAQCELGRYLRAKGLTSVMGPRKSRRPLHSSIRGNGTPWPPPPGALNKSVSAPNLLLSQMVGAVAHAAPPPQHRRAPTCSQGADQAQPQAPCTSDTSTGTPGAPGAWPGAPAGAEQVPGAMLTAAGALAPPTLRPQSAPTRRGTFSAATTPGASAASACNAPPRPASAPSRAAKGASHAPPTPPFAAAKATNEGLRARDGDSGRAIVELRLEIARRKGELSALAHARHAPPAEKRVTTTEHRFRSAVHRKLLDIQGSRRKLHERVVDHPGWGNLSSASQQRLFTLIEEADPMRHNKYQG